MKEKFVIAYASFVENAVKIVLSLTLSIFVTEASESEMFKSEWNWCGLWCNDMTFCLSVHFFFNLLFFIGVTGMFFSIKLANDLKKRSETQQLCWIIFQWISLIFQIIFSYQIFELIESNDRFKFIVFLFTLTDVFVIFSISIIFVSWQDGVQPTSQTILLPLPEEIVLKINDDPPTYEEVMQLNRSP